MASAINENVQSAAGQNAISVVTTSLEKLSTSLDSQKSRTHDKNSSTTIDLRALASFPVLRASVKKQGRDAFVMLDDLSSSPGSLNLHARAVSHEAHEAADHVEIKELDAEELEGQGTQEERAESVRFGEAARNSPDPRMEGQGPKDDEDPYEALSKLSGALTA